MKYPEDKKEFREYLKKTNAKFPERWLEGKFSWINCINYQFVRYIWDGLVNPDKTNGLKNDIKRHHHRNSRFPHTANIGAKKVKILEELLEHGIQEKDIAYLIREYQMEAVYRVLYMIEQGFDFDDPNNAVQIRFFDDIDKSRGKPIGDFTGVFVSAMPKNHPDSDEWV